MRALQCTPTSAAPAQCVQTCLFEHDELARRFRRHGHGAHAAPMEQRTVTEALTSAQRKQFTVAVVHNHAPSEDHIVRGTVAATMQGTSDFRCSSFVCVCVCVCVSLSLYLSISVSLSLCAFVIGSLFLFFWKPPIQFAIMEAACVVRPRSK